MKKTTIYEVSSMELGNLSSYLKENGYRLNSYLGRTEFTIDDGSSENFEECAIFGIVKFFGRGDGSAELRVKNSDLVNVIDSHFKECFYF